MRGKLGIAAFLLFCFVGTTASRARQRGQYVPGQQGLNSGLLPDSGFTYANLTINYSADTLRNRSGSKVPLAGSYGLWAASNAFFYVPNFKILGARVSFMAAPTFANGSVTLGSLNFPNVALEAGGVGLADKPLTLGWNLKRADVLVGYAFMAPTGRYTAGATDILSRGDIATVLPSNATSPCEIPFYSLSSRRTGL